MKNALVTWFKEKLIGKNFSSAETTTMIFLSMALKIDYLFLCLWHLMVYQIVFFADVWSDKPPTKYEIYLLEINSITFIELLVAKLMLSNLKGMILLLIIIKKDNKSMISKIGIRNLDLVILCQNLLSLHNPRDR